MLGRTIHYTKKNTEPELLDKMAESIVNHGNIEKVVHHQATVIEPGKEPKAKYDGFKCIIVEHLKIKYYIHLYCCEVNEIIEVQ